MTIAVGLRIQEMDGSAKVLAVLKVDEGRESIHHKRFEWSQMIDAYIGSAELTNAYADIRNGFSENAPAVLRAVASILGSETS